ncbi:hypothetical protein IT413_00810 [Candidatus Peregrinibacteria bacterium]|nr:hypothetical protein [Candidatus Peregrinibacteria bacterium]
MFKPKLVSGLCHFVGLMLVLKFLLVLVMFVWGFFGQPLIPVVDPGMATHLKFLFFLQDITTTFFMFALVAAVKTVVTCGMGDACCGAGACEGGMCGMCACGDKDCNGECMMPKKSMKEMPSKKAAPRRRVASKE